jgi:hypothetical protein
MLMTSFPPEKITKRFGGTKKRTEKKKQKMQKKTMQYGKQNFELKD